MARYYVVRWTGYGYVYVSVDYSQSHHYRAVRSVGAATGYEDRALAEQTAEFLGGKRHGFEVRAEEG